MKMEATSTSKISIGNLMQIRIFHEQSHLFLHILQLLFQATRILFQLLDRAFQPSIILFKTLFQQQEL